jgi:magnesium transporter
VVAREVTPEATAAKPHGGGTPQLQPIKQHQPLPTASPLLPPGPDDGRSSTPRDSTDSVPFWLDVLNPTEEEMKVISKSFGIHPLTTEDIFLGETREKVELFRHYYLVCFTSFDSNFEKKERRERDRDRDHGSRRSKAVNLLASKGDYQEIPPVEPRRRRTSEVVSRSSRHRHHARHNELKPLNMYIVVFHEGVLSFHFAPTPHTINVRRRARLLRDYLNVSSDWISYALIDDITDGFAPIIDSIEEDVNSIEDAILRMHSGDAFDSEDSADEG